MTEVRLPRLLKKELDSDGQLIEAARFHPYVLSITLNLLPLSTATMTIPEDDPDVKIHDLVEVYNQHGSVGIFRVSAISNNYKKQRVVDMNHALDVLNDSFYVHSGGSEKFSGTVSAYFTKALGVQSQKIGADPYWQIGTCEDTSSWTKKLEFNNVLEMVSEVIKKHEDYMMTFDFSTFPWTMNFVQRNGQIMSEFRLNRNIESCNVSLDDSGLCTKLYLSVATTTTVTENNRTAGDKTTQTYYTLEDLNAQAIWGVVCETAGVNAADLPPGQTVQERVDSWASAYFERHNSPTVQITISGEDLKELTGEAIDEVHLGRICRVALPEYNTTFLERVASVTYTDVLRKPTYVTVSLANKRQTAEDSIAAYQKEQTKSGGGGGGGGGSKTQELAENTATEVEFQKIRYDLQVEKDDQRFAIIASESWYEEMEEGGETLVGQYNANVELTARQLSSAFAISGVTLDADGEPVTDNDGNYVFSGGNNSLYSQVTQTASAITTEVGRAQGAESLIDQKADSIALRVTTAEGAISGIYISDNTIHIASQSINLTGVVYASQLDVVSGEINNLKVGTSQFTQLVCTGVVSAGSVSAINGFTTNSGTFTGHTIRITGVSSATYLGLGDLTLDHYHGITCSVSGGVVTITQGAAQSSAGSDSFNIAATQFYLDAVAAAEASGWDAAYAKVVPPSQGTGTSFDVKVPDATQGNQHTYSFTIQKGSTPASAGYASVALNGTVVGRISIGDWYDAGVLAGEGEFTLASVTLQGSTDSVYVEASSGGADYYQADSAVTYYEAGTPITYYQGNGSYVYGRGDSEYVTPIGSTSLTITNYGLYTLYYKVSDDEYVSAGYHYWGYSSSAITNGTYYKAGTGATYYKGNGSSGYLRGNSVTVTPQGASVSVTPIKASTKKHLLSTIRYKAGTPVTDTYYTKASS